MLELNDDMDELLRRAAKEYPLDSSSADFDKVLEGLKAEQNSVTPNTSEKRTNKNKRLLWLLLLLPLSFVCNRYYNGSGDTMVVENKRVVENKVGKGSNSDTKTKNIYKQQAGKKSEVAQATDAVVSQKKSTPIAEVNATAEDIKTDQDKTEINTSAGPRKTIHKKSLAVNSPHRSSAGDVASKKINSNRQTKKAIDTFNIEKSLAGKSEVQLQTKTSSDQEVIPTKDADNDDPEQREVYKDEVKHLELSRQQNETVQDSATESNIAKKPIEKPRIKRLYAGIVGGPELSTVKFSSLSKPGYNIGALVGYQVNKHLSIETGVQWAKKNYKSDGQNFSTNKLPIPSYVKIISLDGYCQMFELPVGLKYDFKTNGNKTWFATTSISTYFMQDENYNYDYLSYGQVNSRYVAYKNSANNWASVLNISAGFTRKMQKNSMLRVEPFIKIPLQGVGIGSLPISGSGISLGYIRKLF